MTQSRRDPLDWKPAWVHKQPTKPSAGALRAATGCFNLPYGSAPTKSTADWTVEQMAEIIDRETGLAELLEAAKIYVDSSPYSIHYLQDKARLLEAIAKCEGGE